MPADQWSPEANRRRAHRRQEVLRRQRLLAAHGYKIVPDGIWGPRSQRAWNQYLRSPSYRSVVTIKNPNDRRGLGAATDTQFFSTSPNEQPTKEEIAAQKRLEKRKREQQRKREMAQQRAAILDRAAQLQKNPRLAAKLSLRELTEVIVDKEAKFDPTKNRAAAKAIQWHLAERGYNVQLTGVFDEGTYRALKRAFADEARRERQGQIRLIRERLYGSGLYKAGDKPAWWTFGELPEPEKLVKQLQAGGFTADMMMRTLLQQAVTPGAIWESVKRKQLAEIAETLNPVGVATTLAKIGGAEFVPTWQYFADIIAIQDVMPFGDYDRAGFTEEERLEALHRRSTNKETRLRNAQALGDIRTSVLALIKSTDAEDFKRLHAAFTAVAEEKFKRIQLQIASEQSSWWGDALDTALAPGKFMRTALTYDVMRGSQLLWGNGERNIRWEDAMMTLGHDPREKVEYDGLVDGSANPLLRIALDFTADPLNVVAPLRWTSSAARQASMALARESALGGYYLTGKGLGLKLAYQKGTWSKIDLSTRLLSLDDPLRFRETELARRMEEGVRRLAQTKDEAFAAVSDRVTLAGRHGFRKVSHLPPGQKAELPSVKSPQIQKLLDETDVEMMQTLLTLPSLRAFIAAMKKSKASIWLDSHLMGPKTQYGAALTGFMAEHFRPMVVAHIAADVANGRLRASLLDGMDRKEAEALAQQEFERLIQGVGTFLKGGADQSLKETEHFVVKKGKGGVEFAERELRDVPTEVAERVRSVMEEMERVVYPQIQRHLTDEADALHRSMKAKAAEGGDGLLGEPLQHPLWDENGKWVGRQEAADGDLVAVIRKSFDEGETSWIDNPAFGVSHTGAEMATAIRSELRRQIGRLDDYVARNKAAGTLPEGFDYEARREAIEADVVGSWDEGGDGFWYDTREQLEVSNLYVRHLDGYAKRRLIFTADGDVDMLAVLGEHPTGKKTPIEQGLYEFAAMMVGATERQTAAGMTVPGTRGALTQHGKVLREAIDRRKFALREAEANVLPAELLRQGAVWRAWQNAQSRPLRYAWKAANAQMQVWKFSTLALRPAWPVRNHIDNVLRGVIEGVRDPRLFVAGPGKALHNVIDSGIGQLRQLITYLDELFGTNVLRYFDAVVDTIWELPSEILSRLFRSVNIEVPPEVFENGLRRDIFDTSKGLRLTSIPDDKRLADLGLKRSATVKPGGPPPDKSLGKRLVETLWHVTGDIPENYSRKMIYRAEYKKAIGELADSGMTSVQIHLEATRRAVQKVEDTLFDYSKISVIEDNLKVFFPFIQYWRKSSVFWARQFTSKPWLNNAVLQFDDERREAHGDMPAWMRRYFHTDEIADALAVVPGLDKAFDLLGLGDGAMYDPMNMLSFAPFYRAFKAEVYGDNQLLPTDRKGMAIIAPIMDALNDWGLGISPFVRKPLEATGVANYRAWQRIWPQTSLAEVIAMKTGVDEIAKVALSLERISALGLPVVDTNAIADNFDYWVQTVVAEQVAKGEQPDIAAAEETVKDWFFVQQMWAYFGGVYWRRATPEDLYLSKLQDDVLTGDIDYESLTSDQKKQLKLWSMRGYDRLTYERYIDLLPVIESYYRGGLEDKLQIVKDNPEIVRWVDGDFTGHPVSQKFIRYAHRYQDEAMFFDALEIADTLDLPFELKQIANDMFLSPELKAYWDKNRTAKRWRERMIQAEAHDYYRSANKAYFAIPEDDFEARDGFLADHPELIRYWGRNNDPADDYEAIMGGATASLRDMYFGLVNDKGWDGAADFLKQFPFMFEGTTAEKKVKDGQWVVGGGKWSAERQRDFVEAKPHLTWFFDKLMPKAGKDKAWAWLDSSDSEAAKIIKGYLNKYPSSNRLAFLKAQPWLKLYWGMPPAERSAWLQGDSEGAKIVRAYFEKYGDLGQHGKDFLAVKKDLDYYGSLPKDERAAWLKSDDPRAARVLAFFKKYGKEHQFARAFKKLIAKHPGLAHGTPEQVKRLEFWRQYFSLTPDQRPNFVMQHAEAHGIFMYGEFGEQHRHDSEQAYLRRAVGLGLSKRQSAFLYVKPLLDFYRTLDPKEKALFSRANPEIQEYFDRFATGSITGDKKLDALVEEYFKLPPDSFARSKFLREHPKVQDWFDKRNPAEGAMRNLLEQYFGIGSASDREEFLLQHPEINAYFERRREEKREESESLRAFDEADPRLEPFFESAEDLERAAARMRAKLRQSAINSLSPDGIDTRRERRAGGARV